jgi:hypothetical protein
MVTLIGLLATGCSKETSEDQKISAALACIDTAATSTQVDTCLQQVADIQSQKAALIRCSGNFIAQGLTGSRLALAFEQQNPKNGSVSATPTTTMAAYLVFDPALTAHTAQKAFDNCNESGVKSVIGLAALIKVATTIATISGILPTNLDPSKIGAGFDATAIQTQVNTLLASIEAQNPAAIEQAAAIGIAAQSAQTAYCGTGSTLATQDVCIKLNAAITTGSGDTSNIGKSLLNLLKP